MVIICSCRMICVNRIVRWIIKFIHIGSNYQWKPTISKPLSCQENFNRLSWPKSLFSVRRRMPNWFLVAFKSTPWRSNVELGDQSASCNRNTNEKSRICVLELMRQWHWFLIWLNLRKSLRSCESRFSQRWSLIVRHHTKLDNLKTSFPVIIMNHARSGH